MSKLNPDDFEIILDKIKDEAGTFLDFGDIRAIESNFNTKGVKFKTKEKRGIEGMVIAGEDKGAVAVDISIGDGAVRSFILEDEKDADGIQNIVGWFKDKYKE